MRCIICKEDKDESKEHIIPESLGNKTLITNRVCEECNSKLGSNVDNYFVNHLFIKWIRKNNNIYGKKGKPIKILSGMEIDTNTGLKFEIRNGKGSLLPKIIEINGLTEIYAKNEKEGFDYLKKQMKKQGISDKELNKRCEKAIVKQIDLNPILTFEKEELLDISKWELFAIKIAYEYTFSILGEKYIDDEISIMFSTELKKCLYSAKKDFKASNDLTQYVTCLLCESNVGNNSLNTEKAFSKEKKDVLHTIFLHRENDCLYCVIYLFDLITFKIKVTEKADYYKNKLPTTIIFNDGMAYTIDMGENEL